VSSIAHITITHPIILQSYLADPQDEETDDMPMKKSRRTLLVNDASWFDFFGHLPVHCVTCMRRAYVRTVN